MVWHLTESRTEIDGTDELPVLTQEAILEFESGTRGQADETSDPLESSVEALRDALEVAEQRWATLESRLANQDQAIEELQALLKSSGEAAETSPPADETPIIKTPASDADFAADYAPIAESSTVADSDRLTSERGLLERIASLEAYIAGRADRWQEMESDLDSKARRIAELEIELAQRIAREQGLEERLQDEGHRSNELREKLRRINRRLQESELVSADRDLDATRELVGRALQGSLVRFHHNGFSNEVDAKRAPKLICLSAELGEAFVMHKNAITIGRAPDCDIQIATDFVSRRHATILRDETQAIIEDESSTNGVFVNSERVERKTLNDGDEITIGESRFRFVGGQSLE